MFSNFRTKVSLSENQRKYFGEIIFSNGDKVFQMPLSDKEMEVAGRLKLFRESLNIKQKQIATGSETRQGQLSEMESGIKQIQPRVIFFLAERYGLNVDWLFTGRGDMVMPVAGMVKEPVLVYGSTEERLRVLEERVRRLEKKE